MPRARRGNQSAKKGSGNRGSLRHELLQLKVSDRLNQLKGSRTGTRGDSEASEDEAASEVLSHCSSASETVSVVEEAAGNEVDYQAQQEERLDKLKEDIENVMDKSVKTRLAALGNLRLALSSQVLADFLLERRITLTEALERCLKKVVSIAAFSAGALGYLPAMTLICKYRGRGPGTDQLQKVMGETAQPVETRKLLRGGKEEEQTVAAIVLSLLSIQLGCGAEGEELFRCVKPILINIVTDSSAGLSARQSCATCLGLCCYIAAEDVEDLISTVCCLEGIFTSCYSNCSSPSPALQGLLCCAIQAWALLLTICPATHVHKVLESHLPRLSGILSSESVSLRIASGENLALLHELGHDLDDDFFCEDTDSLCVTLKALATDSNKYRAKTDRRKQRSIFRDVLHYIENGEFQEENIKFGLEVLYVDSWARRRTYNAFKEILGSGIRHHLQYNEVLREILSLGPPLVLDAATIKASKISRVEKHMFNSAAFKARTKARNRVRDKRADVF